MMSLKADIEVALNQTFDHMEEMETALRSLLKVVNDMRRGDRFYDDENDAINAAESVLEALQ